MSKPKKIYIVSTVECDGVGNTYGFPRGYFSSQKKAEAAMKICFDGEGYGKWLPVEEVELDPDWHLKDRFS